MSSSSSSSPSPPPQLKSHCSALALSSFRVLRIPPSTLQHVAVIHTRTPLVPISLTVDLGGDFLWVECQDKTYTSSSYAPVRCRTAPCTLAKSNACGDCFTAPVRPGCNNTCGIFPHNTVANIATSGVLAFETLSLKSTDGSNPGRAVIAPKLLFGCSPRPLLQGLAKNVKGMAALGRSKIGLPSQLASAFSFPRKFAICLSSTSRSSGVVFFGDSPYKFLQNTDASQSLVLENM